MRNRPTGAGSERRICGNLAAQGPEGDTATSRVSSFTEKYNCHTDREGSWER